MKQQLRAEKTVTDYSRRHGKHIYRATLGTPAGVVEWPVDTNWVYVQLHDQNQVVRAYNAGKVSTAAAGVIVDVELVEQAAASHYEIRGISTGVIYPGNTWPGGSVGAHASQHQRRDLNAGGFDPLDVYTRALVNLRARAQATPDMTVYVERGFYFIGGILVEWTGGNSAAFTVPAAGPFGSARRCDLLYIGSDYALHIVQGTPTTDGSLPGYPTTPSPCVPIAYVFMTNASAAVTEAMIMDARVILTASDAAAHNLLSATHGDTLAASVAAGDVVIGNDTPKWSRLAIAVPAANVRNVLGVDNGETKPSWKAALDATGPADVANAAAPGTSLKFPHLDHAHRGVVSINKSGDTTLYGAVTLSAGANVTLTQTAQDIAIASTASAALTVKEEDGAPSVANVTEIKVTNGTLTDNGAGSVSLDFGSAATDAAAIHDNVAGEINAITEKATPVDADLIIIEDSADSNNKKKVQIGNLPGGSGNITSTGAAGSEPGSPASGDLYLPNNGYQLERYSGSVWTPWGPIFPLTPPVPASYSWVNQGSATLATSNGGMTIQIASGETTNLHCQIKTAPATSYTIDMLFLLRLLGTSYPHGGFCWRQSSDGKLISANIVIDASVPKIQSNKWNSPTSFNSGYVNLTDAMVGSFVWLRVTDNGTTRKVWTSPDGQNWILALSHGHTDFLTPDQVGFYVDSNGSTFGQQITLLSWKES